jgi:hypothetical protein
MTPTIGAATSGSRPELISATYRRFRRMGFDDPQAANLTALTNGFGITTQPWRVRELTHLLFLSASRRVGRWWSDADDRVDCRDGMRVPPPVNRTLTPTVGDGASPRAMRSTHGDCEPSDGRVTLLTLFRAMAGPNATLDLLRPPARPRLDPDSEGG